MDATHLRQRARQLQVLAEEVRQVARRAADTSTVDWQSLAAERFRERLAHEAAHIRRCAQALDEAAAALSAHAKHVQQAPDVVTRLALDVIKDLTPGGGTR